MKTATVKAKYMDATDWSNEDWADEKENMKEDLIGNGDREDMVKEWTEAAEENDLDDYDHAAFEKEWSEYVETEWEEYSKDILDGKITARW